MELIRRLVERKVAVLCSVGFGLLSFTLAMPLVQDEAPAVLRMSAGPETTRRHAVAAYLSEQAARNDLTIELLPSAGSEESLELLKDGQLEAAIVSNGVVTPNDDDIMVLGAMEVEAVHLLVRKEMLDRGSIREAILGRRVNLGEPGSTEWLLAREFLSFARLKLPSMSQPGDIIPTEYGKDHLHKQCAAILQANGSEKEALIAQLPDCLVVLASMPSPIVQQLVEAGDYRIAPLPATRAFLMDNLQDSDSSATVLQREFLQPTVVPAHCYFASRGLPAQDCETVGVRLLVVARKDLPDRAVQPLMKTLLEGELAHRIDTKSPREIATPYAVHPAAIAYLDRDKPLAIKAAMEWLSSGLSIFGAFSAGALSLYSLVWRRKVRQPSDYYAEIRKVEQLALNAERDSSSPIPSHEFMKHLDDRLLKLRQEMIEDICEGRIKGEQLISNILALLKDARRNLQVLERNSSEPDLRVLRRRTLPARTAGRAAA